MIDFKDLIDKFEDWWPWHKEEANVNPNLSPVLLIPGIGGSILQAVTEKGKKERIWVRLFAADHEFKSKLWSFFDAETGRTDSLDQNTTIQVPDDRYGLYSCDVLDPDVFLRMEIVYYYHDMIQKMLEWGYQEGTTLFGFGYDFRQSNRVPEAMQGLKEKLKTMYEVSGGKKVTIIAHSMGGILVKLFLALHREEFVKYVDTWIAIAVPFQGAPGFIMDCLLTGVEFVKGWQRELFIAKWSMHQLLIECPSVYELMANPGFDWVEPPELRLWRKRVDEDGSSTIGREVFGPNEYVAIMMAALKDNTMEYDGVMYPLPMNSHILNLAKESRRLLESVELPEGIKFYNIFGTSYDTPYHVSYGTESNPVQDLTEILHMEAEFTCVEGDGTVPVESAMADCMDAIMRVGIPGDHRGILNDDRTFRILEHFLEVGEYDPFYDPHNDYVILPTKAEFREHRKETFVLSSLESWETISEDSEDYTQTLDNEFVAAISTGPTSQDTRAEAHAHIHFHGPHDDIREDHIEVEVIGIAEGTNVAEASAALEEAMAAASDEAVAGNMRGNYHMGSKMCHLKV